LVLKYARAPPQKRSKRNCGLEQLNTTSLFLLKKKPF